ncbi:YndJ family transporter [Natrinema halophilum]|nr:YndJ family transporter [Natrinema halophilum]QLG49684.2 YndJ family protein [Natrinema halophilum]
MTDLSAALGAVLWFVLAAGVGGAFDLSTVELYVALAALVLVPLGIGIAVSARDTNVFTRHYSVVILGQPPAALAVVGALAAPQGTLTAMALVVPWLGVTGIIALFGLRRLLSRGIGPLPALAIDVALLYVPVAAAALFLHVAGIALRFAPIIVLLTAVHFHYAGFVLPLVVGRVGRRLTGDVGGFAPTAAGRVATASTLVIIVGIAMIAVGITFSPLIELLAVVCFATAVAGFAVLLVWAVVPAVPRLPGLLLTVASLSILWTMALALAFAVSSLPGTPSVVTIPEMLRWHGSVNAGGFALPAILAVRLLERVDESSA